MLPTPSKSHYTFNLRDISKVMQGMLQIRTSKCADADGLVRLWVHEASRVFCDRLVDDDDRAWFNSKVAWLGSGLRLANPNPSPNPNPNPNISPSPNPNPNPNPKLCSSWALT